MSANLEGLKESRQQFLAMVEDLRPDLHRFCASQWSRTVVQSLRAAGFMVLLARGLS